MTKVCNRCSKPRPLDSFMKGERELLTCGPCREYARTNIHKHRRANPDRIRNDNLRYLYGITPEEYDARRAAQDYRCAICGTHESEIKVAGTGRPRLDGTPNAEPFKLVVDHCHDSRRVRGLLCAGCNSAIGHFGQSIEAMMAAVRYLSRGGEKRSRSVAPSA